MNSTIIHTIEEFREVAEYLNSQPSDLLTFDTETDGVQEATCKLFGFSFALEEHEAFYFPWRKNNDYKDMWWSSDEEREIREWAIKMLTSKRIIGHNVIFDVLVIWYNFGVDITNYIYSDTILLKHTLDEEEPFGLKEVAVKYLGDWANTAQLDMKESVKANGGSTKQDNYEMWRADPELLGRYCNWDVLLTRKLFDIFEPRLHSEGLSDLFYKDEIMPLYREVTIPMKKQGFPVNIPYFQELNVDIAQEIERLEKCIQDTLTPELEDWEKSTLAENYPIKTGGNFPKLYAKIIGFTLPEKDGKVTLARKELDKILEPQLENHRNFLAWLKGKESLNPEIAETVQRYWHRLDNQDSPYIFNLGSNNHLKYIFFEKYKEKPLSKTDKGAPQVDEDFLDSVADKYKWIKVFIDYKKLQKLKSTYIEGVLNRHVNGVIYSSFLQFGPPSGRFASRDPNLQNLPRVKEDDSGLSELVLSYVNSIKKGFIAGPGYVLVNADYSQLEPRAFAEACGDKDLQAVFHKGEDLYGAIAVRVWKLPCTPNEVKKKYPEKRQHAKIIALAVVYGAEAGRISALMGVTYQDAQKIIDDYLNAYPGLKGFMSKCNEFVCTKGYVQTKMGRIRHLPEGKAMYERYGLRLRDKRWAKSQGLEELSWKFKNTLNLAKNFPIQGIAAHIVNRSMIAMAREYKAKGLTARIIATVHDEICSLVKKGEEVYVKEITQRCMETTCKLEVPLKAEPLIGNNWSECK